MATQNSNWADDSSSARKITKYDEAALTFAARHVEITDSEIRPSFLLGPDRLLSKHDRAH